MKFSVVIPTRNRLEWLQTAVNSVLSQDYDNWELIISDNDSTQDVAEYITSLSDPRIVYSKTENFISVTENWNRAINLSTGEYILLMGDDDCLMQGYFSILDDLIKQHSSPDLIFSNGLMYIYPGIIPCYPKGHLITIGNWHLWDSKTPKILTKKEVQYLSKESMNFRLRFSYNMQLLTIRRSLFEKLKINGQFFHSPYPDFYSMTVLFHQAERVLWCPYAMTLVGISPKSFGGHNLINKEAEGMVTLNVVTEESAYPELESFLLPGKQLNTCWLYALRSAQKTLAIFGSNLEINFGRFRRLQTVEFLNKIKGSPNRISELAKFFPLLRRWEKIVYGPFIWFIGFTEKKFGAQKAGKIVEKLIACLKVHPGHINYQFEEEYGSVVDILNKISPKECESKFKSKQSQ